MLADKNVAANIPVKDIGRAQKFYEGKLGLKEVEVRVKGPGAGRESA